MKRLATLFILYCGLASFSAHAATSGKVTGFVRDAATNDPLAGVTVRAEGTELRAISGLNGEYFILNVPVGSIRLEVQMIGYLPIRTQEFAVNSDRTTRIDFELETTILDLAEPVAITAPRTSIRSDLTASSEVIVPREIESLPVTDLSDLIFLQNGVVRDAEGNLHVRGGRGNEISYYVDGATLEDPLLGGMGTHFQLGSVEELVINRGGFNAQYGEAMSGVVNIVTREGSGSLSGTLRAATAMQSQYNLASGGFGETSAGRGGRLEGILSGALPWLEDRGGYFLSGQVLSDGHHIPHNSRSLATVAGNLVFKPYPLMKLKVSGHYFRQRHLQYDHRNENGLSYDFNPDGLPERQARSHALNLSVSQNISPRFFYTARFYRYSTNSTLFPSVLTDRYWTQWPGYSQNSLGEYDGSIYESTQLPSERYEGLPFTDAGDFFPLYRDTRATYYGVRADLSGQITYWSQIRAGAEAQWYRLNWDERSFLQAAPRGQRYSVNPVEGALYFQNKLELSRLIVDAGLRVDYLDTSQRFFVDLPTGQAERRDNSTKIRLSPRLGVSHSFTPRSLLRFNYGYFYQPPEFRLAYANLRRDFSGDSPRLGNPDLAPQKTVAYEFGLEHMLTGDVRIGFTASYKTISNLTSTAQVQYPGGMYYIFNNADFGSVRSVELIVKRDVSRVLSGSFNYTYSIARGSASSPQEHAEQADSGERGYFPLAFDQRHTAKAVMNMLAPDTIQRRILGVPLSGWGLSLIGYFGSGLPYTPTNTLRESTATERNQARLPAFVNLDLRVKKRFKAGGFNYTLFSEVRNVFDRRNVVSVYANTGRPGDDGYTLESFSGRSEEFIRLRRLLSLDPQQYAPPREIRMGFEIGF
ncbi:MAG: TonB-dependent receptor [Gemmatimonadetes bacterium]|nr:TonB-dependent receptor [Gemmatimonadota bacterium]